MAKDWKEIINVAIQTEEQSNLVLWRGDFSIEATGVVVHWYLNPQSIVLISVEPSGRNTKSIIDFLDILDLHYDPCSSEANAETPADTVQAAELDNPTTASSSNKGTLCIIYAEDEHRTSADIVFLPQFGTTADHTELLTLWREHQRQTQLRTDTSLLLRFGSQYFPGEHRRFAWAVSRRYISICFSDTLPLRIPLHAIHQLMLDDQTLVVQYALDGGAQHAVRLDEFGGSVAFEELSLMWRQAMQLRAIEAALAGERLEGASVAARAVGDARKGLRRADSMRRAWESGVAGSEGRSASFVSDVPDAPSDCLPGAHSDDGEDLYEDAVDVDVLIEFGNQSENKLDAGVHAMHLQPPESKRTSKSDNGSQTDEFPLTLTLERTLSLDAVEEVLGTDAECFTQRRRSRSFPLKLNVAKVTESRPNETVPYMNCNQDRVVALYDHRAETTTELDFYKGDVFEVVKRDHASGWWFVLRTPEMTQGWVPSNYLAVA